MRRRQHGFGALMVIMLLLLVVSIGVLYSNRTVLFEQKAGANQMRATQAQQVAEAGIEWATGMLNSPFDVATDCSLATTANSSFRKRYVQRLINSSSPTTSFVPATNVFPGCKITSTGLNCSCPAVPGGGSSAVASLGSSIEPSFTVAFEPVAGETVSVKLTAYGCAAQASACSSTNFTASESNARISVVLKLRPTLRASAPAPLTCGTSCNIGGSFNLVNQDVPTNGVLAVAGSTITTASGTTSTTLAGQPGANALISGDSSLAALSTSDPTCSNSALFKSFFGSTIEEYSAAPNTKTLSCSSASECVSKLTTAYSEGWRAFYFSSHVQLDGNGVYGTQQDPITLVTPYDIQVNGNSDFYGLLFSNNATWSNIGTGSSHIHGAEIACAGYVSNGNGTVEFDPLALQNARNLNGNVVRVLGSWRDFRTNADTLP